MLKVSDENKQKSSYTWTQHVLLIGSFSLDWLAFVFASIDTVPRLGVALLPSCVCLRLKDLSVCRCGRKACRQVSKF